VRARKNSSIAREAIPREGAPICAITNECAATLTPGPGVSVISPGADEKKKRSLPVHMENEKKEANIGVREKMRGENGCLATCKASDYERTVTAGDFDKT